MLEVRVHVGGQLVGVVQALDDAQDGAFHMLAMLPQHGKAKMRAVAGAVQVDLLVAERAPQVVHVVGALDGVVGVPVHAALAPVLRQLAHVLSMRFKVAVAAGRRVVREREGKRIVEAGQGAVAAALVERHHIADFGELFHPVEEAALERADAGNARPAEQDEERRQPAIALGEAAHEGQGDGGARVVLVAARRRQQQTAFGVERPPAVAVPQQTGPTAGQNELVAPQPAPIGRAHSAGGPLRCAASAGPIKPT